ncbi:MAG: hypothetical protein VKP72_13385 [bacterium]|nr:hypothetical protein [bacterium]
MQLDGLKLSLASLVWVSCASHALAARPPRAPVQVGVPFPWKDGTLALSIRCSGRPSVRRFSATPGRLVLELDFPGTAPVHLPPASRGDLPSGGPWVTWKLEHAHHRTVRLTVIPLPGHGFEARRVRVGKGWQIQLRRRGTVALTSGEVNRVPVFTRPGVFRAGRPRFREPETLIWPIRSPMQPHLRESRESPAGPAATIPSRGARHRASFDLPRGGPVPARMLTPTLWQAFVEGPLESLHLTPVRRGTVRLSLTPRGPFTFEHHAIATKGGWQIEFRPVARLPGPTAEDRPETVSISRVGQSSLVAEGNMPSRSVLDLDSFVTPQAVMAAAASTGSPLSARDAATSGDGTEDGEPGSHLLLGISRTGLAEDFPAGGVDDVAVQEIDTLSLQVRHQLTPGWSIEGEFRGLETYTVVDRLLPSSTHTRQDIALQGASMWDFRQGAWQESVGLGYGIRYVSARHSLVPIVKDFVFSDSQLFQGPLLRADLSVRPWQSLRLYVQGHLQPLTFVLVDPLVDGLPDVRRARVDIGAEITHDRVVLRVWQTWERSWQTVIPFQSLAAFGVSAGIRY